GPVGQEAFAVIRDTIAKLNMVALGRVVLARREHVIALEPKGRGLVGTTLRYPYEVRDEKPYFEDIPELKLPKEMLDLAAHIVQPKSGHFDPSQFEDRYENALIDLLKKKQAGERIETPRETPRPRVVNLMEALRASVDAEEKKAPSPSTRARCTWARPDAYMASFTGVEMVSRLPVISADAIAPLSPGRTARMRLSMASRMPSMAVA